MRWLDRLLRRRPGPGWPVCRELMERLTEYLDGAMTPDQEDHVRAHLAACDGCTAAVEQFRMTIVVVGSIAETDVAALDPGLRADLLAAFRSRPSD
jgi:anti-sigma factor RsiW